MPLWLWILLLAGLLKLPLAGLMLWIPFRDDEALKAAETPDSSEEDGGSKALPGGPRDPHPRMPRPRPPRRGPHGSSSPSPPPRVRTHAHGSRPSIRPLRALR
ncbi:MAG TPA: hypothetical protein VK272_06460 [Solirubrobacteraceae bacterium]|nr:hypothetical protein [Solirubrobacteraceae bacterium]